MTTSEGAPWGILARTDPAVCSLLDQELLRQQDGLELIASENFASAAVIKTLANVMTNKYAEGLPGKRYYGGCEVVDALERLAIERACQLFGAQFANVQPHSGAQANAAVYLALAPPGSRILGLDLSSGGHLTHGSSANFSGVYYESAVYGLDPQTERVDMAKLAETVQKFRPCLLIAGASAYPRSLDFAGFRAIADSVGAKLVVDMAHVAGLVATKLYPDPLPHAHVVTTTTHKTLRGPRGGLILWNDPDLTPAINKGVFPGTQGGPLEHTIAAKAVAFAEAMRDDFCLYQQNVLANSQALGQALQKQGLELVTGGSDSHLLLINLAKSSEYLNGRDYEIALGRAAITVNKNTIPGEKRSPFVTSGIRVGTPAVTTRGMGAPEMQTIAEALGEIYQIARAHEKVSPMEIPAESFSGVTRKVKALAARFPLYPDWTPRGEAPQ